MNGEDSQPAERGVLVGSTRLDAILVLLLIVIALAVAAKLAAPFLRPESDADASEGERLAELEARKEAKYREIRDAELDYRTGSCRPRTTRRSIARCGARRS